MTDNESLEKFIKKYWNYYLRLEEEFYDTRNFVEFSEDNFGTYSIEYLKLYLSVCSEIDVVGKFIAKSINSRFDLENANIKKWWAEIIEKLKYKNQYLYEFDVNFVDIKAIIPWSNFNYPSNPDANSPTWWGTYNKVKHNRTERYEDTDKEFFTQANLNNVIDAFAGLYVLEKAYIKSIANEEEIKLLRKSKLFEKEEKCIFGVDGRKFCLNEKSMIN